MVSQINRSCLLVGTDAKVDAGPLFRVRLPVFKGRGGLAKGVNPLSNKALLKALDDDA